MPETLPGISDAAPRRSLGAAVAALRLQARALRLALAAQGLRRGEALPAVCRRMQSLGGRPVAVDTPAAVRAMRRACALFGTYFGGLDTCLVQSLVLACLLAERAAVEVHLGFRDAGADPLAGHAWVTVGGVVLPPGTDRDVNAGAFSRALSIPFSGRE